MRKNFDVSRYAIEIAIFCTVFCIAMGYALYTRHTWEDYYTMYRSSKNLATGQGLVFNPGEKLQTFTSPLNALLAALFSMAAGNSSEGVALWLLRLVSSAALACAAVLLFKIARHHALSPFVTVVLLGLFGMEGKIVAFSVNGQETGFMMLFLALTLYALLVPSRSPAVLLGVAWAGLMWTRTDGFVYFGGIALGVFFWNAADRAIASSRRAILKLFVQAGVISAILYAPWFCWAWFYYGSPVPHTILAKGLKFEAFDPVATLTELFAFPLSTLAWQSSLMVTFAPINAIMGEWPYWIFVYSKYLAWGCAFYWLLPFGRRPARAVSFAFMIGSFYLSHIASYGPAWYLPNCAMLGIFVFPYIVQQGLNFARALQHTTVIPEKGFRQLTLFIRVFAVLVMALNLGITLAMTYQIRIQQRVIEEGQRKEIGVWLRQHAASPKDTVFLEPLGYIGYFSQLRMYDFPGLSSPEVVAARKKLQTNDWDKLILELQPDWLVLRTVEAETFHQRNPEILTRLYALEKVFDVSQPLAAYRWLPGRSYLQVDQTFLIFRRKTE